MGSGKSFRGRDGGALTDGEGMGKCKSDLEIKTVEQPKGAILFL